MFAGSPAAQRVEHISYRASPPFLDELDVGAMRSESADGDGANFAHIGRIVSKDGTVAISVVSPRGFTVERSQQVADGIRRAPKHIDRGRLIIWTNWVRSVGNRPVARAPQHDHVRDPTVFESTYCFRRFRAVMDNNNRRAKANERSQHLLQHDHRVS